jgi:hypothetical protein
MQNDDYVSHPCPQNDDSVPPIFFREAFSPVRAGNPAVRYGLEKGKPLKERLFCQADKELWRRS